MSDSNSRQEYLKRYLDGYQSKSKKKKLKLKNSHKQSRIKIVDEDIDIKKIEVPNEDHEVGDEAPFIVDVIDERPDHVKINEIYSCTRWKKVENSVPGEERSITSRPESKDSSEFKKSFSNQVNKKEQNILSKPQAKQSSDCVDTDVVDLVQSKKHSLDRVTCPLKEQVRDEFYCKKSPDSASNMNQVKEASDASTNLSPPIGDSKEIYSVKSFERAKESMRQHDSDSDFSPARRNSELSQKMSTHSPTSEESDERQSNSDNDLSPPRGRTVKLSATVVQNASKSKILPKLRHDSDGDISPPRAKINDMSDSDLSPPRSKANRQHHKQRDFSPPRKNVKHSSGGSYHMSPKRNRSQMQHSSDSDFSPPRISASSVNKRYDSDNDTRIRKMQSRCSGSSKSSRYSPPLEKHCSKSTKGRHDSDGDSSPLRDRLHNSPERKNSESSQSTNSKRKSHRREKSLQETHTSGDSDLKRKRPTSTLSGMKAGLQDASTLREETHFFKHREQTAINELSDELSGRNSETILRDKDTGRKRNIKEEKLRQKEEVKKNAEKQEKYLEWGKGLKQKDDQQKRLQDDMYEMSKPLARYANDEDLERELKNVLREGDPMLEYAKKKRQKSQPVTASLPLYQGPPAPPNRFNILPGYRWDGVDRSNGYEKKFFEKVNSTKAKEQEAYLWSIENM